MAKVKNKKNKNVKNSNMDEKAVSQDTNDNVTKADNNMKKKASQPSDEIAETAQNDALDSSDTEQKLAQYQTEIDKERDARLRILAEYDNYRRRTQSEYKNIVQLAGERIIRQLLPVLDDFERLFKQETEKVNVKDLWQGVELIHKKMLDVLASEGLKSNEVLNQPFDADAHEAIAQLEDESKPSGVILAVAEKGYYLGERIIRHPKVVVNSIAEQEEVKENE